MTALSLFASNTSTTFWLSNEWRVKAAHQGEGARFGYAAPDYDDGGWAAARLPHLRHATAEQDTLWYRSRFESPAQAQAGARWLLRFGGAFYHTSAWLNGVELGSHEGYFQPFGFDVTELLRPGGNLLAVRCRFPVEAGAFKRKTAVAGIFTDWDCKPYPSQFYPNLPAPNEWTVPIGLWQPVGLQASGPVVAETFTILPEVIDPNWEAGRAAAALVRCRVRLRNVTSRAAVSVRVALAIQAGAECPREVETSSLTMLQGGEGRELTLEVRLLNPQLWFPWTHGLPYLYQAVLQITADPSATPSNQFPITTYSQPFGIRDIRAVVEPGRWEWQLNGRRIFPKGSNYISDFYLDRVTGDGLRRDVELAKGANLDLLRVHAHIAPPDFYRFCDELGLLVMCDFPLIWTYGFNLSPEDDVAFRERVRTQVDDMIRLLGSHPSIGLWSMHNEPPWTPDGSFLGSDVHESATNRKMDEDSAALARALDPTRPVIPASGIFDQHLYHGWYTGGWGDNGSLRPTFPTEFGVQALPNLESPFWATVNTAWPVDAEDVSWAHSGYQSIFWASPGVGTSAQFKSLSDYVSESQAYQAFFIRYVIDQWRRQKFNPVGGYIHFLFTDGWPAITWSVLDYFRLPKAGYRALAEASRPVRVCVELEDGFKVERTFQLVFAEGGQLKLSLWLVNDDYRRSGEVEVGYWIEERGGGWRRLGRAVQSLLRANVRPQLPGAAEGALLIQKITLPLRRSGDFTLRIQLRQRGQVLDTNFLDFRVGEARAQIRPPRQVPGLLVGRVYVNGSLRHTPDGFTFQLRNPAMPVTLERLRDLQVDGQPVDMARVEFVQGGLARGAASISPQTPLEIPSGTTFAVVVRERTLGPGLHSLSLTAEFMGLGEVSATLKDRLG